MRGRMEMKKLELEPSASLGFYGHWLHHTLRGRLGAQNDGATPLTFRSRLFC